MRKAILIIHGFGGGPWENEFLANYLELTKKYDVYTWTLKNHHCDIISKIKYTDWINESRSFLEILSKKYNTIYLVGHSMGGVIATALSDEFPKVKKLVLLAPAFNYGNWNQNNKDFKDFLYHHYKKEEHCFYNDFLSKIFKVPIPTVIQFTKLVKNYRNNIINLKCPTLFIHGREDELVPISSTTNAYSKAVNCHKKYLTIVDGERHRLLRGAKKELISKYIYKFFRGGFLWIKNYKEIL